MQRLRGCFQDLTSCIGGYVNKMERLFSTVFGVFLLGVGAYVLFCSDAAWHWVVLVGLGLILLGGNLIYSAYARTPSWLSRIGPLP